MTKYLFLLLPLFVLGRILLFKAINICKKMGFEVNDFIFMHIADHSVLDCLKKNKNNHNQANKYYYLLTFLVILEMIGWLIVIEFILNYL